MWFWCKFGATLYRAILTIFTISNNVVKTRRDKNIVPLAHFKTHLSRWVFVFISREQLNLPVRASEVIFDSEVHFVSEVSPIGEVANLTSLMRSTNSTVLHTTSLLPKAKTSPLPYHFRALRTRNTEITSKSHVHIFKEYKAKMAETIDHDLH